MGNKLKEAISKEHNTLGSLMLEYCKRHQTPLEQLAVQLGIFPDRLSLLSQALKPSVENLVKSCDTLCTVFQCDPAVLWEILTVENPPPQGLGERLRILRESKKLSIPEMSRKMALMLESSLEDSIRSKKEKSIRNTLQKIESGKLSNPTTETIRAILYVLETDFDTLVNGFSR